MMCLRELVAERESHACGVTNIHYMFSIAILGFLEKLALTPTFPLSITQAKEEVDGGSVEQCAEWVHHGNS